MGCGVSKPAVSSPTSQVTDNPSEPEPIIDMDQTKALEFLPTLIDEHKEIMSPRSLSSKSCDSDTDSDTSTEKESTERPPSPIRIKARGEGSLPTGPSPVVSEMKKGFIAFDVPLDDSNEVVLDSAFKRPLPRRLRHLEPLGHTPQITTEILMSKLEKAEEKRQKALARRREHSARKQKLILRKNEQMGDTMSTTQLPEDMLESDQSGLENVKSLKDIDSQQIPEAAVDGNTNWNEGQSARSELATNMLEQTSEESEENINQNNNSVETRFAALGNCLTKNDFSDSSVPWPSSLIYEQQSQALQGRISQPRYGCFLQAVQEEEEGEEEGDDEFEHDSCIEDEEELERKSVGKIPMSLEPQENNSCVSNNFCSHSKFRSRGF